MGKHPAGRKLSGPLTALDIYQVSYQGVALG